MNPKHNWIMERWASACPNALQRPVVGKLKGQRQALSWSLSLQSHSPSSYLKWQEEFSSPPMPEAHLASSPSLPAPLAISWPWIPPSKKKMQKGEEWYCHTIHECEPVVLRGCFFKPPIILNNGSNVLRSLQVHFSVSALYHVALPSKWLELPIR